MCTAQPSTLHLKLFQPVLNLVVRRIVEPLLVIIRLPNPQQSLVHFV